MIVAGPLRVGLGVPPAGPDDRARPRRDGPGVRRPADQPARPARRWGRPWSPATAPTCTRISSCAGTSTCSTASPVDPRQRSARRVRGRAGLGRGGVGLSARATRRAASFGDYGFPRLPDLLDRRDRAVRSSRSGLPAPWYAVYGNHDTAAARHVRISLAVPVARRRRAQGADPGRPWPPRRWAATRRRPAPLQRLVDAARHRSSARPRVPRGHADARAAYLSSSASSWPQHFATDPTPGPVGHGFTQANLDTGETWWSADPTPQVRALRAGHLQPGRRARRRGARRPVPLAAGGAAQAQAEQKLALVLSHHNSLTLENRAPAARRRPGAARRRGVRRPAAGATRSWSPGSTATPT